MSRVGLSCSMCGHIGMRSNEDADDSHSFKYRELYEIDELRWVILLYSRLRCTESLDLFLCWIFLCDCDEAHYTPHYTRTVFTSLF